MDSNGYGKCEKMSSFSASGELMPVCYATLSSSCTDLRNVDQDIETWTLGGKSYLTSNTGRADYLMSFEACKGEIGIINAGILVMWKNIRNPYD